MLIKLVTGLLLTLITRVVTPEIISMIKDLVAAHMSDDLTGPAKKAAVLQDLYEIQEELLSGLREVPGYLISMAVDIAYSFIKTRKT